MKTPNFDLIWSQNSPLEPFEFDDADYLEGWNTVGSTPPARTMFDAQQRNSDLKAQNLNKRMSSMEVLATKRGRQPLTAYRMGEMALADTLPAGYFLQCKTAGTTASGALLIAEPFSGMLVPDGTVVWKVLSGASINIATLLRSTYYEVGSIVQDDRLASGLVLECTKPGTTDARKLDIRPLPIGSRIPDGSVVWTVKHPMLVTSNAFYYKPEWMRAAIGKLIQFALSVQNNSMDIVMDNGQTISIGGAGKDVNVEDITIDDSDYAGTFYLQFSSEEPRKVEYAWLRPSENLGGEIYNARPSIVMEDGSTIGATVAKIVTNTGICFYIDSESREPSSWDGPGYDLATDEEVQAMIDHTLPLPT